MPVTEFNFDALKEYITSSRDKPLRSLAKEQGKKYVGSSSSMTGALAHFHFLLSHWRQINTQRLSQGFPAKLKSFTALQRSPSAIFLRWDGDSYAIDADKEFDSANILSFLGKSMEKLLTLPTHEFERYRKSGPSSISEEERNTPESYHYCTIGDFVLRSQLDAHDARLPGTGMFDLKTRAVVSIRMNAERYHDGLGYEIKGQYGEWESYEREYFDMIRAAFLKYSLQVRMGRMDGIFVAFHNVERIFGFQYISLPEMDSTLHGTTDTTTGDLEFKLSLDLLNKILDRATTKYPEKVRVGFPWIWIAC
jgi:Mitochondrial protein Pet127